MDRYIPIHTSIRRIHTHGYTRTDSTTNKHSNCYIKEVRLVLMIRLQTIRCLVVCEVVTNDKPIEGY